MNFDDVSFLASHFVTFSVKGARKENTLRGIGTEVLKIVLL